MNRKLIMVALTLAMLVSMFPGTASATQRVVTQITTRASTPVQVARLGSTRFVPSPRAASGVTSAGDPVVLPANRRIPSKDSGARLGATLPIIAATNPISTANPADLIAAEGLNGYDNGYVINSGGELEPPDQALCASTSYVIEAVNLVLRVYGNNLSSPSADMSLFSFFGVDPATQALSDPRCFFDVDTQRFFVSILEYTSTTSAVLTAVSATANPYYSWILYSLDTTDVTVSKPGCPCLADQPLIGADKYGVFLSTNEFSIAGTQFYGAQLYGFDKLSFAMGTQVIGGVHFDLGTVAAPGGGTWYSVQPALATDGINDTTNNGTEYFLSALDFFNAGDTTIEAWAWTNTRSLRGLNPNVTLYGAPLSSELYIAPAPASQKAGNIPLGHIHYSKPEGKIQTNDDRMNQVNFAQGLLWAGLNTAAMVPSPSATALHTAIAYWAVRPKWTTAAFPFSPVISRQGYVSAKSRDVYFPSIAVTSAGRGIIAFTLSSSADFPSFAYAPVTAAAGAQEIHYALRGVGPADGFSEYDGTTPYPRWGDYSAAVTKPGSTRVYFASEYIAQTCTDPVWTADYTCGGTRTFYTNWSTGLGMVTP